MEQDMNKNFEMATVRVQCFNPDTDKKPYLQDFQVPTEGDPTLLDALQTIKSTMDGSVTFRRSCRHAICGSCAMSVNGRNILVCHEPLKKHLDGSGRVTIRPLPYLPIIKDLVVDRSSFWKQYLLVKPWLIPPEDLPEKEFRMTPEEVHNLADAEHCIMCGACYSACTVVGMTKEYIGPHALLKEFMRVMDPRDTIPAERLEIVSGSYGVARCHTIFNCIDACPKHLDPTKAIETLRNLSRKRQALDEQRRKRQETLA
jgi:succinate dehydrogenase / fumarate reductase iron-sulfur subunit